MWLIEQEELRRLERLQILGLDCDHQEQLEGLLHKIELRILEVEVQFKEEVRQELLSQEDRQQQGLVNQDLIQRNVVDLRQQDLARLKREEGQVLRQDQGLLSKEGHLHQDLARQGHDLQAVLGQSALDRVVDLLVFLDRVVDLHLVVLQEVEEGEDSFLCNPLINRGK